MRVKDCMTREVLTARPDQTLEEVASMMLEADVGSIPVTDGERLIGMITDRDIAVRGVALGLRGDAQVRDAMTHEVLYCFETADIDATAINMGDMQVRRLPVVNSDKRLVGILSTGDLARETHGEACATALSGVSQPGGAHNQSTLM